MNFDEYQQAALRTAGNQDEMDDKRLLLWAVALAGEVGEFCNMVKKKVGHGHDITAADLGDELGDVLWYTAAICATLGLELDDVAEDNIAKLRARYPDGFSQAKSINRER